MSVSKVLSLRCIAGARELPRDVTIDHLVIAGWTGRDHAALEHHIRELEAIGVARPKHTPIFYRVSVSLLTTADAIEVIGADSSGEAEFVLFSLADGMWVGVGSDHTDRKAETQGVTLSKQMCAKPIGAQIWRYADVREHWDRLVLRSWADDSRRLYQEGPVTAMRHPDELIELCCGKPELPVGHAMFCGTLAVRGGVESSASFEIELEDPVLGRKLSHQYRITQLPIEG